jgi:ubiquinone/menaquinone biosynthesis C-methylase UbiE
MDTGQAYNRWAEQYDTNENRTRDMEAIALKKEVENIPFHHCLEIGCGTGKNTGWLVQKAQQVTAVDLSESMLDKAKNKIKSDKVQFIQADINQDWKFAKSFYDLVSFSLVLEHIELLEPVFKKAAAVLAPGGHIYIGELHPFKQYAGSKARFETLEGPQVVDCFTHHISDFIRAGRQNGLMLINVNEFFDEDDPTTIPRILTVVLQKQSS